MNRTAVQIAQDFFPLSLLLLRLAAQVRRKPLRGGVFGHGGFDLASHSMVVGGLDHVSYLVMNERGLIFGHGSTKREALYSARIVVAALGTVGVAEVASLFSEQAQAQEIELRERSDAQAAERRQLVRETLPRTKSIPKRRREIFDASGGACHYCKAPLTLDGKWHIEHKMPRALLGDNQPSNLVASCTSCNFKKRDQTDVEFIAKQGVAA